MSMVDNDVSHMQTLFFQKRNEIMDMRCRQLQKQLADLSFSGCVLKGQGVAYMYPND